MSHKHDIGYVNTLDALEWVAGRYGALDSIGEKKFFLALCTAFDKIESLDYRWQNRLGKKFPRYGEQDVPREIKLIQVMEAYHIATRGDVKSLGAKVTSRKIGDMAITYDNSNDLSVDIFANPMAGKLIYKYTRKTFGWSGNNGELNGFC